MPKWLTRLVLAIYPGQIRNRYGDEIAGLLATSTRPARDLANVARCALIDRVTTRATFRAPTIIKLLLVPLGLHLLNLVPLALLLAGLAALRYSVEVTRLLSGMLAGLVAVLVFWWARRAGRKWTIASRDVVVPVTMAVGLLSWWLIPLVVSANVKFLPLHLLWAAPSITTWCVGMILLNAAIARLRKRIGGWALGLITAVGGFAILELCTIAHLLAFAEAPASNALWWYPMRLTGYSPGNAFGFNNTFADVARGPEAMLTLCTVFALTLAAASLRLTPNTVAVQPFRTSPSSLSR